MEVNSVVRTAGPEMEQMPRTRITMADIAKVKEQHIKQNLLYTPDEAGQILSKSAQTILNLVKDGKLLAADECAAKGKKASNGLRITAESLEVYRKSIIVSPESWAK